VQRHGLALLYHRVATPSSDPWDMSVSPAHFAEHLSVLRRLGPCLPLGPFADSLAGGSGSRRQFTITFDDGYRDNANAARHALEAADVPATMFVVSSAVGTERDFWWDALARVLLTFPTLPADLHLETDGGAHHWALGEATRCGKAELARFHRWSVEDEAPSHPRQQLFLSVWTLLNAQTAARAETLCRQVTDWAGADRAGPESDRAMSEQDVAALAASGLIEIGGHTVSHVPLDLCDADSAAREIGGCRRQLAEIAGRDIVSFSYPFGRLRRQTPEIVRAAGFRQACNSRRSPAFPGADRFRIPRLSVCDMDGDGLAALIQSVVGAP
jgi:peptidoglycan/xylan/chitin deacetylase (PgdA/CDA1 family)